MRERQDVAGGTLDRLNDALSSLENRIGIARDTRAQPPRNNEIEALSSIRARQNALRAAVPAAPRIQPAQTQINSGISSEMLNAELRQLRAELDHQMSSNFSAGFDTLRKDLRGLKTNEAPNVGPQVSTATAELRNDIASLKQDVARLAREDTLQDMLERWGVLEREIADLPQKLGSRDDLISMLDRLDQMQDAIATLPQTSGMLEVEAQVRTLAVAVERLAENSEVVNYPIESIDARFDELTRAIAALPTSFPVQPEFDTSAFDRIEARIGAVASKLDEHVSAPANAGMEAQLNELIGGLQHLQSETSTLRAETRSAFPIDALDDLSERVDQLAIHMNERNEKSVPSTDEAHLNEMNERLLYIIEKVNANDAIAQDSTKTIVTSFDQRMNEIAERIDANERVSAAVPTMDTLEMRLDEIAQLLSAGSSPSEETSGAGFANLEAQIAELAQSLGNASTGIDQDSLLAAARIAADEAVAQLGANASGPAAESIHLLADDLKALESLARDSDDRNSRTFEAIHDTLLKVVDHLSGLEDTVRSSQNNAPAFEQQFSNSAKVSAPAAPMSNMMQTPETGRIEIPDAPSISPDNALQNAFDDIEEDYNPQPKRRQAGANLSPAEAAAAAARAAGGTKSEAVRTASNLVEDLADEPAQPKSLLKGMAQKLRRGAAQSEKQAQGSATKAVEVSDDVFGDTNISDEPIEPGSGGADLSAIMRRVREERAGTAPAATVDGQKSGDDNGKSDFIAAARRAAKAAAADATVVSSTKKMSKASGKSSLGAMLQQRKKPILIAGAAGAILLALVPLLSGFFGGGSSTVENQAEVISVPAIEGSVEPVAGINDTLATDAENIGSSLLASDEQEGSGTDTNLSADDASAEAVDQQAYTLADIPENVGPIALREAAVSGDAKALYIVGDYFTGGVPGKSENDLAKAIQWYERSAELGYAPAQYRVGNFYEKGFGVERDFENAKTWYQLAAEQGNAAAMHNLAVLFANGPEGTPDFASATRWFQKAADLGVKDSQFNLGILTAKGEGVTQDLAESYKWFSIAAKTGDKDAEAKRDEVANALRPDQLQTARDTTELWKAQELIEDVNIVSIPDEWRTDAAQTAAAPEAAMDPAEMKKAIRNIQGILNNNGYNAGPADGVMGSKTEQAILAFKKANGLDPTPDVTETLVRKLLEVNSKKAG